jgi:hypothetical protein
MNARPDARDFAGPQKFGIGQPVRRAEDGRARAASASMPRRRPWATGLRTNTP